MSILAYRAQRGQLRQVIEFSNHLFGADTGVDNGGDAGAPDPHEILDAALAACTGLTLGWYARRRGIPLTDARIVVGHAEGDGVYRLRVEIELEGDLTPAQRADLLRVAEKCPVHKSLTSQIEIETLLADGSLGPA
jgi:putative redox protein